MTSPRTVALDLHNHFATQEQDNTPFTPAVQVLHAMRQALVEGGHHGGVAPKTEHVADPRAGEAAVGPASGPVHRSLLEAAGPDSRQPGERIQD